MASAHYLLNDMLDRNHDRQHVAKWRRPQATGQMLPRAALGQATALVTVAVICATSLPTNFRLTLAAYLFVCLAYSIFLKRLLLMDILTLSILFDLRLVAGASAAVISLPGTLLLACSPFFLTLAMFKRITQLSALSPPLDRLPGRPYSRGNLTTLRILAGMGSATSVVALAIFLSDTGTKVTRPGILWFALLLQTIWLSRCFVLAIRGVLNEDIVFFVITDLYSYVVLFALTLILIAAG
jgi:4-hydroxybenzoate polyprenyltransferase